MIPATVRRAHSPARVVTAGVALAALACSPHRVVHNPAPPVALGDAYRGRGGDAPMPERWWRDFGDPRLDALVDRALSGNFQLRAAYARIEQARAVARQAASGKWPQIDASASAQRASNRVFFGPNTFEFTQNQYRVSASAAYEVDLFRRIGSQADAASLDVAATRDDLEAMALSIAAETAEAWFDLVLQRQRRALLEQQLQTNETFVELVKLRFERGLGVSAVDVLQARSQVAAVRAQLALSDALEQVAAHRLALLVGVAPGSLDVDPGDTLPALPPLPRTGVPADLLLRRPDVRAMRRRVEAADHRYAAAIAARLPRLSLQGEVFSSAKSVTDLIAKPLYNLAGNLLGPLFDGGRRAAEADRARAAVDELTASFGQILLAALLEVENALALEKGQAAHIAELERQVEISRGVLRETRSRYRDGLTDFLPVLNALSALHASEQQLLAARRQLISYRIQLCRALGGTWTSQLARESRHD